MAARGIEKTTARAQEAKLGWIVSGAVFCVLIALCFLMPGGMDKGMHYAAAGAGAEADPLSASIGLYMLSAWLPLRWARRRRCCFRGSATEKRNRRMMAVTTLKTTRIKSNVKMQIIRRGRR